MVGQFEWKIERSRRFSRRAWVVKRFGFPAPSGTGKTTVARILAKMIADDYWIQEYDSGHELTTEAMNSVEETMHYYGGSKGGRAFIVNESHGLRAWVVRRLLGLLERLPSHVVFIFTTTVRGDMKLFDDSLDAMPLLAGVFYRIGVGGYGQAVRSSTARK